MRHGICVYHLVEMKPCTGKRCEKCELSPAYAEGLKAGRDEANKRLDKLMKEIIELVSEESYERGYEKGKMAAGEQ